MRCMQGVDAMEGGRESQRAPRPPTQGLLRASALLRHRACVHRTRFFLFFVYSRWVEGLGPFTNIALLGSFTKLVGVTTRAIQDVSCPSDVCFHPWITFVLFSRSFFKLTPPPLPPCSHTQAQKRCFKWKGIGDKLGADQYLLFKLKLEKRNKLHE